MPTAHFRNTADKRISDGTYTYSFNPSGDVSGAEAEEVRFDFKLDYNNGSAVDLDKIQIWLQAPDGDRDRIYYNFPNANVFANDNDDHNDSDDANDWDIDFDGVHKTSKTTDLSGAQVTGTWRLIIENDTGKTLDLDGLEVWVDYKRPEDYTITDLEIVGGQRVDQPVQIRATVENIGELYKFERVDIEYLVNGEVIGTSALLAGLSPGADKVETELHSFDLVGANTVTARIVGSPDTITSNNSLTRTFIFDHNDPDLAVSDIRVTGSGEAGSTHYITADVTNLGNSSHTGDILLEYLVAGDVIGTQTIGGLGVNVMLPGTENSETEAYFLSETGLVDIEVRIANPGSDDYSSANDSLTKTFSFEAPDEAPDLAITDLRVIGGWEEGETVNLRAHIENIGNESWNVLVGLPYVEYFVRYEGESAWETVGGDALTGGSITGFSEWVSTDFTLAKDGPFQVRVDVRGRDYEPNTENNTWREHAGHSRADTPQKNLENSASDVNLAAFLARTVYGIDDVPSEWRDDDVVNGLNDDYSGYLNSVGFKVLTDEDFGDLFRPVDEKSKFYGGYNDAGEYEGGLFAGDQGLSFSDPDKWQAQGLVAEGDDEEGNKTLTLTFRGTDASDMLEASLGQAWTGDGLYDYYESMRPLIEAALAYANDSSNGIEKLLVTGHSLGGATADAFALVDAHRLKASVDLTVVSLASPGVDLNFLDDSHVWKGMLGQYDRTDLFDAWSINAQPFYIGVSHRIDPVTYPALNPLNPLEKVPNQTLLTNLNMDDKLTAIVTPNIDNDDLPGYNFGAGHNVGLYWANLSQIMTDPLKALHAGHRITVGLADYSQIEDLTGAAFGVFTNYVHYDAADGNPDDDEGQSALVGNAGKDFILGFSGNDALRGEGGEDLLSGGSGDDTLEGGAGDDVLDGGEGTDVALYSGSFFDYLIETKGDSSVAVASVSAPDAGVDELRNIEELHFVDGTFSESSFVASRVYDSTDLRVWASYVETFNSEGVRTARTTTYDDGRVEEVSFANGVGLSKTTTDVADAFVWQSRTETFDAQGTPINRTIRYDDGRVHETAFVNGVRSEVEIQDLADTFKWADQRVTYDENGNRSSYLQTSDEGVLTEIDYVLGIRSKVTRTDVNDVETWLESVTNYNAEGTSVDRTVRFDDGRVQETTFVNGIRSEVETRDLADAFDWAEQRITFDENGSRTSNTQTSDEGVLTEIDYVLGIRAKRTQTDVNDVETWAEIVTNYDALGARVDRTVRYDDGQLDVTVYADDFIF